MAVPRRPVVRAAVDLDPTAPARSTVRPPPCRSRPPRTARDAVLRVRGIDGADGQTFGAHLHAGPCVAGDPAAALGHYNTDVLAGVVPPEISEHTEVWLDFTVDDGAGTATANVPFVPLPGRARSSSTRRPPTTTPGPPVPGSPASRWSGDAAGTVRRAARRRPVGSGRPSCSCGCSPTTRSSRGRARSPSSASPLSAGGRGAGPRRPGHRGARGGGGWPPCPACCSSSARAACSSRRRRHGHGAARPTGGAGPRGGARGGTTRWSSPAASSPLPTSTRWRAWPSWWPRRAPARVGGSVEVVATVAPARRRRRDGCRHAHSRAGAQRDPGRPAVSQGRSSGARGVARALG